MVGDLVASKDYKRDITNSVIILISHLFFCLVWCEN